MLIHNMPRERDIPVVLLVLLGLGGVQYVVGPSPAWLSLWVATRRQAWPPSQRRPGTWWAPSRCPSPFSFGCRSPSWSDRGTHGSPWGGTRGFCWPTHGCAGSRPSEPGASATGPLSAASDTLLLIPLPLQVLGIGFPYAWGPWNTKKAFITTSFLYEWLCNFFV